MTNDLNFLETKKKEFEKKGYLILKTDLLHDPNFLEIKDNIYLDLNNELKNNHVKRLPGYIMGNLNVYPGKYGYQILELLKKKDIIKKIEFVLGQNIQHYNIEFGGNLSLANKGLQLFHIDGNFLKKMTLISIATEDIGFKNGPTEVCVGTHKKDYKFWEFVLKKKEKTKLLLNTGEIVIRKHNLWHRGTKNNSNNTRLLLSMILTSGLDKKKNHFKSNEELKIGSNFFKKSFF